MLRFHCLAKTVPFLVVLRYESAEVAEEKQKKQKKKNKVLHHTTSHTPPPYIRLHRPPHDGTAPSEGLAVAAVGGCCSCSRGGLKELHDGTKEMINPVQLTCMASIWLC